jgi:serine/threonine-protein kinase HipA
MILDIYVNGIKAGILHSQDDIFSFQYDVTYKDSPISLTMPLQAEAYVFKIFPPFFDGLLPEGGQLDGLLRIHKLDRTDYMGQLLAVGSDLVGNITVKESQHG